MRGQESLLSESMQGLTAPFELFRSILWARTACDETNKLPAIKEAQVRGADEEWDALKSSLIFSLSLSLSLVHSSHLGMVGNTFKLQGHQSLSLFPWHSRFLWFFFYHILSIPCCLLLLSRIVWIIYSMIAKCNIDLYNKQKVNTEYSIFYAQYSQLSCLFFASSTKTAPEVFHYCKK